MSGAQSPFDENLRAQDEHLGFWLRLVRTKDAIHRAREEELRAPRWDH